MFLLNSCLSLFTAAPSLGHPFSRSYGAILPSSLTMLLPSALGFSPHPPVSVYGTGAIHAIAAFLAARIHPLHYYCFAPHRVFALWSIFTLHSYLACTGLLIPGSDYPRVSPHLLMYGGAGILTCCPSATHLCLTLGPDCPAADQLYGGNLGYSAGRILTFLSLLIPAFSLL